MAESVAVPSPQGRLAGVPRAMLLTMGAAILAIAGIAGALAVSSHPALPGGVTPLNAAVEARWGVRVSQVAMTADGGLVDFRFVVLDPTKAVDMMSSVDNLPILKAEDSGVMVTSTAPMGDDHSLVAGHTYFLLYRNSQGAIRPGTPVTVIFPSGLTIEHVVAR